MDTSLVKIWEQEVVIPTYETGLPEKNPMFFEKRVYQGSSGAVYPNPIIEKIYDEKTDKAYHAVFLENRFIKIMVLPQLGGRIQMAFDKIANRHFIYYNEVIKPALVGLCGPWISGGIEFNWPQHHRPSTFERVDYTLQENEDGSKTIWVNEIEKMFRTKGMAGFTLHPDKAFIEIKVKLFNRTALPQTFLWWANPAVKVNDDYQSVFPPDVNAVFDHGKRDVSAFPIATGEYYKVDYSPGTDISRYKNIPVPTSYMAIHSAYDFVGGYEHDTQAGLLHVANHHVSPGKKQWTWGHSDFGKAWDRNLTDENGPYIELMTGVFTDNQPDFSWLMPYEEKTFTQYFLPYRELGMVKNATKDLLLHFSITDNNAIVKVFATHVMQNLLLEIRFHDDIFHRSSFNITPEIILDETFRVASAAREEDFEIIILNDQQEILLHYQRPEIDKDAVPPAATAPLSPADTTSNEALFLTGLHLEQYRHATYNPVDYYEEALRRDAGDIRSNNALGVWYLRRGQFKKSEPYFRKAIETLVNRNSNPYDGEPYYNLGLCLQLQQCNDEAYAAFYKSTWNSAWQANGFFALSQIDIQNKKYQTALQHIELSLDRNAANNKAIALKMHVLRKLNRFAKALQVGEEALQRDVFNLAVYFEKAQLHILMHDQVMAEQAMQKAYKLAAGNANTFLEYAIDFSFAGLYAEAIEWLQYFERNDAGRINPMLLYYIGYNFNQAGNAEQAAAYFSKAAAAPPDYCFPNKIEDVLVLQKAIEYNPDDSKAWYYLGCLWYDKRQYADAIHSWEQSVSIDDSFPAVHRNLGIAWFNKQGQQQKALDAFEKAFALNPKDSRILMELDQLYKRLNTPAEERLLFLEKNLPQVLQRDDLYLERITLYNFLGEYDKAFNLLMDHKFHPWEGGEGKVSGQYKISLLQMARNNLAAFHLKEAIENLQQAQVYPHNLGEGKLYGTKENEIFYLLGCAYEELNDNDNAMLYYKMASQGSSQPSAAIFYNDQQPDTIFYQGLAWYKLQDENKAVAIFNDLIAYGEAHLHDEIKLDYFAVSLPDLLIFEDDLNKRNKVHCQYMMALGYLGLREFDKAMTLFNAVLAEDASHLGARLHARLIPHPVPDRSL